MRAMAMVAAAGILAGCGEKAAVDGAALAPHPAAPFEAGEVRRATPQFKIENYSWNPWGKPSESHQKPVYSVGHKTVTMENRPDAMKNPSVFVEGERAITLMWWGSLHDPKDKANPNAGFGYPFKDVEGEPGRLEFDEKTGTTRYVKPFRLLDGKRSEFKYEIMPAGESRVKVAWESPDAPVGLWVQFASQRHRTEKILFGGKRFTNVTREELLAREKHSKWVQTGKFRDVAYMPDKPEEGLRIAFAGERGGHVEQGVQINKKTGEETYGMMLRPEAPQGARKRDYVIIDLGVGRHSTVKRPEPVGGVDFWRHDATEVVKHPVRNVLHNPSFEQGWKYYTYQAGGAAYNPVSPEQYRYQIVATNEAKFGEKCLLMRDTGYGPAGIRTFPAPTKKGVKYTLSFWAKAKRENTGITVSLANAGRAGKYLWYPELGKPESRWVVGKEWKRYERTFEPGGEGIMICMGGGGETLIDGLQLEEGEAATEFTQDPVTGELTSAREDNAFELGDEIELELTLKGKPGVAAKVDLRLENPFRERLYEGATNVTIGAGGKTALALKFDKEKLGQGIFVLRTGYEAEGKAWCDHFRFDVMKRLENRHATKNITGTLTCGHLFTRGDDVTRKYMEWGFGSTTWGSTADYLRGHRLELEKKYRIDNLCRVITSERHKATEGCLTWESITPEQEKALEELAYNTAKTNDARFGVWTFSNEEESRGMPGMKKFDEYAKAQLAVYRGVKRANPKLQVLPTCGTSGYNMLRGFEPMDGYLGAAAKAGVHYDGVAVHPYGSIDRGLLSRSDLDEDTQRLLANMKKHGYSDDTPIYFTEMFNLPVTYVPEWGAGPNSDLYNNGKASYDFGNREVVHAGSMARTYLIGMKYHPRLKCINTWFSRPFMDGNITPTLACKAVNTLGNLLPDVRHTGDIKPFGDVRGYMYALTNGMHIAAVWTTNERVEKGLRRGPVLGVKFGQEVECRDLMGNRRRFAMDKDGVADVPLTPMPLFVIAKDGAKLLAAFEECSTDDTATSLQVNFLPAADGQVKAQLKNKTARTQRGTLKVGEAEHAYEAGPNATVEMAVGRIPNGDCAPARWECDWEVQPEKGSTVRNSWRMEVFYVPRVEGNPDWAKLPAMTLGNAVAGRPKSAADIAARYKMAWNEDGLWIRIEIRDDKYMPMPEKWKEPEIERRLWEFDNAAEIYFDCGANARLNTFAGFDLDDYRYDFAPPADGKPGKGHVWRFREVDHQLADGVNMPSKNEASRNVECNWVKTETGHAYEIRFRQRYLEPLMLQSGFASGFGLFVHDHDGGKSDYKGLSNAIEEGEHCDHQPHLWQTFMLR